MERTIDHNNLQAVHRIATEDTVLQRGLEALLDSGDILLGDVTALNLVDELQRSILLNIVILIDRTDIDDDVGKLTATTRLLLVDLTIAHDGLGDGFLIVHLRLTLVALHLKLTLQTVDDDVEVEFTHTGDDGLTTLLVGTDGEGRVFLSQLSETVVEFGHVGLALRLNGNRDNRVGEGHRLQHDGLILVAEGVTRTDILEAYTCTDITGIDRLHGNLLVGVHLEQTADTLLLARTGIKDVTTSLNLTRINTEEHQTSHVWIGGNLECQSRCGSSLRGFTILFLIGIGVGSFDYLHVNRCGQECTHSVEQRLNALVLIRRTQEHRGALHRDSSLADCGNDLLLSNGLGIVEVLLHQGLVILGSGLEQFVTPLVALSLQVSGDFLDVVLGTHSLIMPQDSLHLNQVDQTLEVLLSADRYLDHNGVGTQNVTHLLHGLKEVGTRAVHLVYITDTRHIILVGLTPYCLRLRLYAISSRVSSHGSVEHTQGALHLSGEVHVSRSINQVNLKLLIIPCPVTGRGSGSNRNSALLLLGHPVHRSGSVVHLTNLVRLTRIEQDTLRGGGLSGIDVSHNTDVSCQI